MVSLTDVLNALSHVLAAVSPGCGFLEHVVRTSDSRERCLQIYMCLMPSRTVQPRTHVKDLKGSCCRTRALRRTDSLLSASLTLAMVASADADLLRKCGGTGSRVPR